MLVDYHRIVILLVLYSVTSTCSSEEITVPEVPDIQSVSSKSGIALDASFEFNDHKNNGGLEGWGGPQRSGTSNEMNAHIYSKNGIMRLEFVSGQGTGKEQPHVDSPPMFIPNITPEDKYTVAIRYRYVSGSVKGTAFNGKIRLRGGDKVPGFFDHGVVSWSSEDNVETESSDYFRDVYFPVHGDGKWYTTYAYFYHNSRSRKTDDTDTSSLSLPFTGNLTQMRLYPVIFDSSPKHKNKPENKSITGQSFQIDWIRLIRGPTIERITGCSGEKYYHFSPSLSVNDDEEDVQAFPNVEQNTSVINDFLQVHQTIWKKDYDVLNNNSNSSKKYKYSSVYNCWITGGELITIEGKNFGVGSSSSASSGANAHILIDGNPCTSVQHDPKSPQTKLMCRTPPRSSDGTSSSLPSNTEYSSVEILHGKLPGLFHHSSSHLFSYAKIPPKPQQIQVSNIASHSIDLSWKPGGSFWNHMTYTGFHIQWRPLLSLEEDGDDSDDSDFAAHYYFYPYSMIVGNITTTTVRSLLPDTSYIVAISGLTENQEQVFQYPLDLYGRRHHNNNNSNNIFESTSFVLESAMTTTTAKTLQYDVSFDSFNANSTLNHTDQDANILSSSSSSTVGPKGMYGGEGHFGLTLVGDAHIENCNISSYCCDLYDYDSNTCSNSENHQEEKRSNNILTCRRLPLSSSFMNNTTTHSTQDHQNLTTTTGIQIIQTFDQYNKSTSTLSGDHKVRKATITSQCGSALRLTSNNAMLKGASWYPRQLDVGEGFDTTFVFRITNPSFRCDNLDKIHSKCKSRGGDGFAFVIQNSDPYAISPSSAKHLSSDGNSMQGHHLGYHGIPNSIAIEFDTFYNFELNEPYENHLSVHTRGYQYPNDSNHTFSLGHTTKIPDLLNGQPMSVRIKYIPSYLSSSFSKRKAYRNVIETESFMASPHIMYFLEEEIFFLNNKNNRVGRNRNDDGRGNFFWTHKGLGALFIYVRHIRDDDTPVLIIPLHLKAALELNHDRAWCGFTAATGIQTWQVHDILSWKFSSLRYDD